MTYCPKRRKDFNSVEIHKFTFFIRDCIFEILHDFTASYFTLFVARSNTPTDINDLLVLSSPVIHSPVALPVARRVRINTLAADGACNLHLTVQQCKLFDGTLVGDAQFRDFTRLRKNGEIRMLPQTNMIFYD